MPEVDPWLDTSGDPGVQIFSVVVGGEVRLCHSYFFKGIVNNSEGSESQKYNQRGYRIVYKQLGEFVEDKDQEWNCVRYKHTKSGKQVIEFTEDVANRRSYIVMQSVPVHDHSSIPMGGPAYATYYSEPSTTAGEEGG